MSESDSSEALRRRERKVRVILNSILIGFVSVLLAPLVTFLSMIAGSAEIWTIGCFIFGPAYLAMTILGPDGSGTTFSFMVVIAIATAFQFILYIHFLEKCAAINSRFAVRFILAIIAAHITSGIISILIAP